jgi:chromosome segregation ATPase
MSQESPEPAQSTQLPQPTELPQPTQQDKALGQAQPSSAAGAAQSQSSSSQTLKLVPVTESIKYRRRAQQAEGRLQEMQQQLDQLKLQMQTHQDQLSAAQSQRDQLQRRLVTTENHRLAEQILGDCGVLDVQTAATLLSQKVNLAEELSTESLSRSVEELLLDKPCLRHELARPSLPSKTASPRSESSLSTQLSQVARQAATSGDRRDIAQYLRLRRQNAMTSPNAFVR